jgi:cathepsin L
MRAVILFALLGFSAAYLKTSHQDLAANPFYSFTDYQQEYSKSYSTDYSQREEIFNTNLDIIRTHNADSSQTYKMGLNEFTDLTSKEFTTMFTGLNKAAHTVDVAAVASLADESKVLPDSVDWRTQGVVSKVKNQASCGSCWAFSAVESIESAVAIATKKLLVLSEQQIVSCSPNPDHCGGTGGCKGSTQPLAFNYTLSAGITSEADYPYAAETKIGVSGKCKPEKIIPVAGITGFKVVPKNNYTELMTAVATVGPVSISAATAHWQLYEKGVFSKNCGTAMDHGIQLVGYGADGDALYWTVRNSWGATWGEKGYIRVKRYGEGKEPCAMDTKPQDGDACNGNKTAVEVCGECAILCGSSYPTGAHLK